MPALDPRLSEALAHLPEYLGAHVVLSLSALLLGIGLSLPLALVCLRSRHLSAVILASAAVVQTIPSLALLALFYPLLLLLSAATKSLFGAQFSALGFLPSLLALSLYSMLPILRNAVTGIRGIDPSITEAAMGSGMTPFQTLTQIEFPLALPVIMAGIRTASVLVIGTATLSTPIGQTSLGNYIFSGLQTQNWVDVVVGCVAAALLAIVIDRLLAALEILAKGRTGRRRLALAGSGFVLVLSAVAFAANVNSAPGYVIGAKGFPEQYILSSLIQQRLAARGLRASTRNDLGSAVIFKALLAGDVDVYVDYTGTIWSDYMHHTESASREVVLSEVSRWVSQNSGARVLGALGFENAYVLAMRKDRAASLGVRSVADLAQVSGTMAAGGDYEIFSRPEWRALQQAYGLRFREQRQMQPIFVYRAAADADVDVITAYSSDGRIDQYGLVTLADPKHAIPPYDAIVLIAPKRANDSNLAEALQPLLGRISVEHMREVNLAVGRDDHPLSPAAAASRLWQEISAGAPSE
jgi:osmoprotectant transport system permease protein